MALKLGVLGIDHGHIFGMLGNMKARGCTCDAYWTDGPAVTENKFTEVFPELTKVADRRAILDSDADMILGLDAGANDYVTKPFKFAVLLARIRAQLRQHEQSEDAVFTVGQYTFRPSQKLLTEEDGNKVRLTEKETAIMKYLYRAEQKVISRDELLEQVWGYNSGVTTHTLETHIYRLRQKIERDPSNARLLVTEGGGYKLVP